MRYVRERNLDEQSLQKENNGGNKRKITLKNTRLLVLYPLSKMIGGRRNRKNNSGSNFVTRSIFVLSSLRNRTNAPTTDQKQEESFNTSIMTWESSSFKCHGQQELCRNTHYQCPTKLMFPTHARIRNASREEKMLSRTQPLRSPR